MFKILLIGIGAGDPDYLTVQAVEALNRADVFFIPDKGDEKAALRQVRLEICRRFIRRDAIRMVDIKTPPRAKHTDDYRATVRDWHGRLEAEYERAFRDNLGQGECGAFLVWGDPTLYDSTMRILDSLSASGVALDYDVIPGISAVQALAARHRIALNRIGAPVLLTTGRRLAEGWPGDADTVVVLLDGQQAFRCMLAEDVDIYWGAYLGTPDEILIAGRLADVADDIDTARARAAQAKGWIMDTYLLRRREKM